MSDIERWTIEGRNSAERTLVNVAGPTIPEWAQRHMVREEDYDTLADAYQEAVKALNRIERVYERTMPSPRDALRDQVLAIIAAYRGQSGPGEATG